MSTAPPPRGSHEETTQRLLKSIDLHLNDISYKMSWLVGLLVLSELAGVVAAIIIYSSLK